jgi:hypothetical protein
VHWQLPSSATTEEREGLFFKFLQHVLNTCERFGCEEGKEWSCTIGMNKKGGMKYDEFEHYIVPLFPDLENTLGKCILIKVDSGPGCNGWDLLHLCWFRSVNIYSGLLNATSIQQKTDINYGLFKGIV